METKSVKIVRDRKEKKIDGRKRIAEKVFEETKKELIPNMQNKLKEIAEKVSNLDNSFIWSLISSISVLSTLFT